jgi:hypothetical protein
MARTHIQITGLCCESGFQRNIWSSSHEELLEQFVIADVSRNIQDRACHAGWRDFRSCAPWRHFVQHLICPTGRLAGRVSSPVFKNIPISI